MSDITVTVSATNAICVQEIELIFRRGAEVIARRTVGSGEYLLGSDTSADLRLEELGVAPRHARLIVEGTDVVIEDLGSGQRTLIDGKPAAGRTAVGLSKQIQLGEATLEIQRLDSPKIRLAPELQNLASVRRLLPDGIVREKKYEIGEMVAQGGMGKVLDAHDALIRRNVAMKVMLKERATEDAARFIQEAQITGQLEHPGIVPIYELGIDADGEPFYTMKFVRGITLRRILQLLSAGDEETVAKFSLANLLTAFQKVCDAIAFAHSRQVIHRDLKPDNIMLGDFGEVLVMDWGLAKVFGVAEHPAPSRPANEQELPAISSGTLGEAASMTLHGAIMGTPQFMSPEQARGEIADLDERSDIYALGAILYQILTLRPVVEGATVKETLEQVRLGRITPPAAVRQEKPLPHLPGGRVPESLSAVCTKALATRPADRYGRVEELQREIQAYQNGFATSAERAGLFKLIHLALLRHKTEASILAASVLLLLGLGAFAFHHVQLERDIAENERNIAKAERNVAKAERDRAETTLDQLRGTAPTFLEQAQARLDEGKFDLALTKIAFAISLEPRNADYLQFRANLLQSSQRLEEAANVYRDVLRLRPDDANARKNLAICERLIAQKAGETPLKREGQVELFEALMAQGRGVEAAPLALALGSGREAIEAALRARLKEYQSQANWNEQRVRLLPNGMFFLNLNGLKLGDLSKLRGFPIRELDLGNTGSPDLHLVGELPLTKLTLNYNFVPDLSPIRHLRLTMLDLRSANVTDLAPLAGMPLVSLLLDATRVNDLAPLKGMPLEFLSLRNANSVSDLTPLAGLPLRDLDLQNTGIQDISPLRGLPLRHLSLCFTPLVDDFGPLDGCATLEELGLPFHAVHLPLVSHFPKLRRVRVIGWTSDYQPIARYRSEIPRAAAAYLQLIGVIHAQLGRRPPSSSIRMDRGQLSASFAGMPIRDLTGLEGLPLRNLDLSGTPVQDIAPLRNTPLVFLRLDDSAVTDVAPLADLRTLEELVLPLGAKNVALLRPLPKLRYLSVTWNEEKQMPAQTAAAFWAAFDLEAKRKRSAER